jgi:hypothetical protein
MGWFLVILVTYCIISWIVAGIILKKATDWCVDRPDTLRKLRMWGMLQGSDRIDMILGFLFTAPAIPLILIKCYFQVRLQRKAWKKFRRTHRRMLFEPVLDHDLPDAARRHFELYHPLFVSMNFQCAGTYLLKPEPFTIYATVLLGQSGETIAQIEYLDGELAYSFTSVLADGQVLETACAESVVPMDHINASQQYFAVMTERGGQHDKPGALLQLHNNKLIELEDTCGSSRRAFTLDQVRDVIRYANDLFGCVKYELGELDGPRPIPILPVDSSAECGMPSGERSGPDSRQQTIGLGAGRI